LALRALYRDVAQPLSMRMRAAIESLPYENPKLSAMAVTAMDPNSFAKALDLPSSAPTALGLLKATRPKSRIMVSVGESLRQ
jgi:hypothetical protein